MSCQIWHSLLELLNLQAKATMFLTEIKITADFSQEELVNPIFIKDGDNVKVKVAVKFIDNQTKATQVSQYELVLHKDSNWKIVG